MSDRCGLATSNFVKAHYQPNTVAHSDAEYVIRFAWHDEHTLITSNTIESSFQRDEILKVSRYGVGHRIVSNLQGTWFDLGDWQNNYTSMQAPDMVQTFIEHLGIVYRP
eukprot:224805_1